MSRKPESIAKYLIRRCGVRRGYRVLQVLAIYVMAKAIADDDGNWSNVQLAKESGLSERTIYYALHDFAKCFPDIDHPRTLAHRIVAESMKDSMEPNPIHTIGRLGDWPVPA